MNTLNTHHRAERWRKYSALALLFIVASGAPLGAEPVLIWADEFAEDGLPDSSKWLYDVGGGGWGEADHGRRLKRALVYFLAVHLAGGPAFRRGKSG